MMISCRVVVENLDEIQDDHAIGHPGFWSPTFSVLRYTWNSITHKTLYSVTGFERGAGTDYGMDMNLHVLETLQLTSNVTNVLCVGFGVANRLTRAPWTTQQGFYIQR